MIDDIELDRITSPPPPEFRTRIGPLPDGRIEVRVSKSFMERHVRCPEQARATLVGAYPFVDSKASAFGTAAHYGAERTARLWQEHDAFGDLDMATEAWTKAAHVWFALWERHGFALEPATSGRIGSMQHGANLLARVGDMWLEHVVPTLCPDVAGWEIEQFKSFTLVDDDRWVISIVGAADLNDGVTAIDYKTGRPGQTWRLERYDVQTTIYSLLHSTPRAAIVDLPREHPNEPKIHAFERTDAHAAMLIAQLEAIAAKAARGLDGPWDIRPVDTHCSERQCPVFAAGECRGAHPELAIFPDERTGR